MTAAANSESVLVLSLAAWLLRRRILRLPKALGMGCLAFLKSLERKVEPGIRVGQAQIRDSERLRHSHIVGATGSGKTVLLEKLIQADLERGHGLLIIDPKGDRELLDRVRFYASRFGRQDQLKVLSATYLHETSRWNPSRLGNPSELQSKFYAACNYSEPHYAKACELALLESFRRLEELRPAGHHIDELVEELKTLSSESSRSEIRGVFLDVSNLALSEWGPVFGRSDLENGQGEVSLADVAQSNGLLYVDLPTEAKLLESARIGRLLLQELLLISGMRKRNPALKGQRPFSIYIDEFDAFAYEGFSTLLNKGRSSDFMIHLSHQTLSDLNRVGIAFAGQIMGNCNVRFIFRQDDPDDAERWSRFLGTQEAIKTTYQTEGGFRTGRGSLREVQEFRVSPDEIKELPIGECILSIKTRNYWNRLKVPRPEFVPRVQAPAVVLPRRLETKERSLAEELGLPVRRF